jgi:flagellar hook protein FlgE
MSILNTSVSGMSSDQNWLSSISQNVANANTTGYKNLETDFSTMVDQVATGTAEGAGVQTSSVSLNALQGSVVSTQTATNLAVQGAGFFVVSDSGGNVYLTRNGSFVPDSSSGNLVNGSGYYLMANNVQNGQAASSTNSLSSLQKVNVERAGLTAEATTSGSLAVNLPSMATTTTTPDQTSLVVYDSLGAAQTVDLQFTNTGANAWTVGASVNGTSVGSQTLTFTNGALPSGTTLTLNSTITGSTIPIDLSNTTQLATGFAVTSATANGSAPATLTGVSIAKDGTLSYNYSNGASVAAYDIPLANVASPDNLSSVSGGAYTTTAASGPIFVGSAGSTLGSIESSSLESSTVDIATELTDMIRPRAPTRPTPRCFRQGPASSTCSTT